MSGRRQPTPEELKLWRRAMRDAAPLGQRSKLWTPPPHADLQAEFRAALEAAPMTDGPSSPRPASQNPTHPKKAPQPPRARMPASTPAGFTGVTRSELRRARRGGEILDATLDLHGETQVGARAQLRAFLRRRHADGARCVLVITGKGAPRSPSLAGVRDGAPGVLRRKLPDWLAEEGVAGLVNGYREAHQRHGGAGAYYVFLKRGRGDASPARRAR